MKTVKGVLIGLALAALLAVAVWPAQAQSYDGSWHVVIDEKGKAGVLWDSQTGRLLYSHKGVWTNGPFSHWREATASE